MAKGKTIATCVPCPAPKENFNEKYSFDKQDTLTPREQLLGQSKWEKRWRREGSMYPTSHTPKEDSFMKGTPHKFKHARPAKAGHRIGKR